MIAIKRLIKKVNSQLVKLIQIVILVLRNPVIIRLIVVIQVKLVQEVMIVINLTKKITTRVKNRLKVAAKKIVRINELNETLYQTVTIVKLEWELKKDQSERLVKLIQNLLSLITAIKKVTEIQIVMIINNLINILTVKENPSHLKRVFVTT